MTIPSFDELKRYLTADAVNKSLYSTREGYAEWRFFERAAPSEAALREAYDEVVASMELELLFDEPSEAALEEYIVQEVSGRAFSEEAERLSRAHYEAVDAHWDAVREAMRVALDLAKDAGRLADWDEEIAGTGSTYYTVAVDDADGGSDWSGVVVRVSDHVGRRDGTDREGRVAFLILLSDAAEDVDVSLPVGSTEDEVKGAAERAVRWIAERAHE